MRWQQTNWDEYKGKHRPKKNVPWHVQVEWTRSGQARYKPGVRQKDLELATAIEGILICEDQAMRVCYHIADSLIGACEGDETRIIRIEWLERSCGIHGMPVSERKLLDELRDLKPDAIENYKRWRDTGTKP